MNTENENIKVNELPDELVKFLLSHARYSFADIDSYDELTSDEKKLISEEKFNKYMKEYFKVVE